MHGVDQSSRESAHHGAVDANELQVVAGVLLDQPHRTLGAEGAVRLVEEHAGDDLQFIRVNGTVVGGLAGGAIYAVHVILRAVW